MLFYLTYSAESNGYPSTPKCIYLRMSVCVRYVILSLCAGSAWADVTVAWNRLECSIDDMWGWLRMWNIWPNQGGDGDSVHHTHKLTTSVLYDLRLLLLILLSKYYRIRRQKKESNLQSQWFFVVWQICLPSSSSHSLPRNLQPRQIWKKMCDNFSSLC